MDEIGNGWREEAAAFHQLLTLLDAATPAEALERLYALMSSVPVAGLVLLYRPNQPEHFTVTTLGVPETPESVLSLCQVLARVQSDFVQKVTARGEEVNQKTEQDKA